MKTQLNRLSGRRTFRLGVSITAILLLAALPPATAAPGSWTQKAEMPRQVSTPASCVVDGILYVMGGHYPYQTALKTVWAYDPQTDSWTQKADLPAARRFSAAAAVNGIIYVVGGSGVGWPGAPVLPVAAYNPTTDTWTNGANMLTGRAILAACAVDGIIYAIGGYDVSRDLELATVEAYDPRSNRWTTKRPMPQSHWFLTASAANGHIYVFYGRDVFAYDPKADSWTTKTQHFSPFSWGLMSAEVNGTIYLFGGFTEDWEDGNDLTVAYDPAQDKFTACRKLPRKRATSSCGVNGGKVYLSGGISKEPIVNSDAVYHTTLDVFDPQGGVMPQILSVDCESTNHLRLAWQGEAGIRYGVESRPNVANGSWTRAMFSSGSNSVLATNALVEATCLVPTADTNRFFRVLEL
jgi:N-acetylneuraminic acid mutarotase